MLLYKTISGHIESHDAIKYRDAAGIGSFTVRIILYAPNVHCGGGLTLLHELLRKLPDNVQLIVDARCPLSDDDFGLLKVERVKPTLWGRITAELFLRRLVGHDDNVLMFGNLPPIFRLKGDVRLFLQNRYLVDDVSLEGFSYWFRFRITMERLWLKGFNKNVGGILVQTPSMRLLVKQKLGVDSKILPFVANAKFFSRRQLERSEDGIKYDFIYLASGEPHKNHRNLIRAWSILTQEEIRPSLVLTLNHKEFPGLISWVEKQKREYDLNVTNFGSIPRDEVYDLFRNSRTLVFPSTLESFGIPLIEARNAGLTIVASELDFVRDLVDPEETFDPTSPISIARAVRRFLDGEEETLHLLDAGSFLNAAFKD